ncbi:MAG: thioredoxin family protein [Candidatus Paceibacterota bacterium]
MREIQKYRYVLAAILTITVFVMGMLFSNLMDDRRYQSLQNEVQENNVEMESRQIQLSYLKSADVDSCSALEAGLIDIIRGYNDRLERVQQYQEDSFFKETQFENIKREYILSGVRYWMYAQELREKCDYRTNTVLFFTEDLFGNPDCEQCSMIGSELSLLKRKYGEELLVFTMPMNIEDGAVKMLEQQYNVTSTPTLIINGEKHIGSFNSSREIESRLNFKGNNTE